MKRVVFAFTCLCFFVLAGSRARAQTGVDGEIVDEGLQLTGISENAPEELKEVLYLHGDWKITGTDYSGSGEKKYEGIALVDFVNRGHGYMERTYIDQGTSGEYSTSYKWVARVSQDGGATWNDNWKIEFEKGGEEQ